VYGQEIQSNSLAVCAGRLGTSEGCQSATNSNRILTQRPYEKGPFIIADVVQHESTGPVFNSFSTDAASMRQTFNHLSAQ